MIFSAIIVALLATISNWWFSHTITRTMLYPLWIGFLTGIAMGEPLLGMQAAAYINLAYLGWITAGGSMPGNLPVAGLFGTALTILSQGDPALAVSFAVPFSMFGLLSWNVYMTVNAMWVHRAEAYAEQGNLKGVVLMNYVPSFFLSLLLNGLPAFLLVAYGGDVVLNLVNSIPEQVITALTTVGGLMPALGIAMLLNYMGKRKVIPFFFLGFFLTVYLGLDTMSVTIFGAIIALVLYYFESDRGNQDVDFEVEELDPIVEEVNLSKRLTKTELIKHFLLGYSSETAYNYERLQALGRASASTVLLNKLYETKEEKSRAIKKYFVFFNTEPSWVGTVIHGIEASMEEQQANGLDVTDEAFNSVRTGLMGPLAGIGDTVSQGIAYPILAAIACSLAIEGNFAGPIMFEVIYKVLMIGLGWTFYKLGYNQGKESILKFLREGTLERITELFSIVGLMVVGNMAFSRVNITSPLAFTTDAGGGLIVQEALNMLLPGVLPLIIVLGTWWMIRKYKPTTVIVVIFVLGIILSLLGVIAASS